MCMRTGVCMKHNVDTFHAMLALQSWRSLYNLLFILLFFDEKYFIFPTRVYVLVVDLFI